MCRPPPSPPGAPFIGPFAGGLVVSDWRDVRPAMSLTLPSERSSAAEKARGLHAAASFRQRRRQVRLAYPQGTHVLRLVYRFIRSALQRPSVHSMPSGRSNIARLIAKVPLGLTSEAFIL